MSGAAADAPDVRAFSLVSGAGRVAIGLSLLIAPEQSLRLLGFSEVTPATKAVARIAGVRDFVLGGVTLGALDDRERLLSATVANATADAGDSAAFAMTMSSERTAGVMGLAAALPATAAGAWTAWRLS
jgi:uncharacterized protein DUF4267